MLGDLERKRLRKFIKIIPKTKNKRSFNNDW